MWGGGGGAAVSCGVKIIVLAFTICPKINKMKIVMNKCGIFSSLILIQICKFHPLNCKMFPKNLLNENCNGWYKYGI